MQITKKDEQWLKNGVIANLVKEHHLEEKTATLFFEQSPLLKLLYQEPEEIFHYDTFYWANFLMECHAHHLKK